MISCLPIRGTEDGAACRYRKFRLIYGSRRIFSCLGNEPMIFEEHGPPERSANNALNRIGLTF
jgi:hypothetical protein